MNFAVLQSADLFFTVCCAVTLNLRSKLTATLTSLVYKQIIFEQIDRNYDIAYVNYSQCLFLFLSNMKYLEIALGYSVKQTC